MIPCVFLFADLTAESLLAELEGLSLGSGSPSVFECQLRIFDGWFKQWTHSDKSEFIALLCDKNPEVAEKLKAIHSVPPPPH